MEKERLIKQTKTVYTEIIKRLVNPTFKFSEGGATQKTLSKFIDLMSSEFGAVTGERLVDMCIFAAYIYKDLNRKVNQIFGPTTIKRFTERKRGQRYYEDQWLETASLSRAYLISLIVDRSEHPLARYIYVASEESTKSRLLNKPEGYLLCQLSTLGWSPKSESCQNCNNAPDCQKATERKYPEIYRLRIENGNNSK